MEKIVLIIISICFLIGLSDYVLGDKLGLGDRFKEGINNMGPLALAMVGILTITPIISHLILKFSRYFQMDNNFDISILISSFIAVDMGAFNISETVSASLEMKVFSGILIASIIGCTISFTLPLALGIVNKKYIDDLNKGIIIGFISIPAVLFISGILLKINIKTIIISLIPIIIMAVLLSIGLIVNKNAVLRVLSLFGKLLIVVGAIGLGIQGMNSILGLKLLEGHIMPLNDCLNIVGKIGIFLGGAYVLIEIINIKGKKVIEKLSRMLKISNKSTTILIGSLASAVIVFTNFDRLDERGRVICTAFSVGGAYVLGGQLGFVAVECPEYVHIYIITKVLCGLLSIILVSLLYPLLKKGETSVVE